MKKERINMRTLVNSSFLSLGILFLISIEILSAQKKEDFAMEQSWFIFSDWKKATGTKVTWNPKKGDRTTVLANSKKNGILKADLVDGKINALYFSKDEFSIWATPEDKSIGKFIGKLLYAFEAKNAGLVQDVLFEYSTTISQNGYSNQEKLLDEFSKLSTVEVESINKNVVDEQTERSVIFKSGKKSYTVSIQNPFGNPVGDMVSRINQFQSEIDSIDSLIIQDLKHGQNWEKAGETALEYAQEQYKQFGSPKYRLEKSANGKWNVAVPKREEEKLLVASIYPDSLKLMFSIPAEVLLTVKGLEKSQRTMTGDDFLHMWKRLTANYEVYLHQSDKADVINPEKSMLILKSDEGFYHFVSIRHKKTGDKWESMEVNMYPFIDE
jgi:hypothetical protein